MEKAIEEAYRRGLYDAVQMAKEKARKIVNTFDGQGKMYSILEEDLDSIRVPRKEKLKEL